MYIFVRPLLLLAILVFAPAASAALTDSFTVYPFDISITRVYESRVCSTQSLMITITALSGVEVVGGRAELLLYNGDSGTIAVKDIPSANLSSGETLQLIIRYRYCPGDPRDPFILLKLVVRNNVTGTTTLRYFVSRIVDMTLDEALSRIRELEAEVDKLRALLDERQRLIDALSAQIGELKARIKELEARLDNERSKSEALRAELAKALAELNRTEALLRKAEDRAAELELEVERLSLELASERTLRAEAEARLNATLRRLEELRSRYVDALRTIESLRAELREVRDEAAELERRLSELRNRYEDLLSKYNELVGRHEQLRESYMALKADYALYGTALMGTIAALSAIAPPAAIYLRNKLLRRRNRRPNGNGGSAS